MSQMTRISKSRFITGLQCHKLLWWKVNEPDAPELQEVDPAQQAIFDTGHKVGELAQERFPGGVLINFDPKKIAENICETNDAINAGATVIYEASFMEDGVFVAVDILEKTNGGWSINEVKSTTTAKPQHLPDAAVQAFVLQKAGLELDGVYLMHLNRECRYPDLSNLFARADLTKDSKQYQPLIKPEIDAQIAMLSGPLPNVEIGTHCTDPYDCPFYWRCWQQPPEHHIGTMYRLGAAKAMELEGQGIYTIYDIPAGYKLNKTQQRQRQAVLSGEMIVVPGLKNTLRQWDYPIAHLDFETINMAIPVWNGCRPYDQVPVQFSCHVEDGQGNVEHFEFLADGPDDPREALARAMLDACQEANTILAYNAGFEKRCIRELAEALPHLAEALNELLEKVDDLLPVIRNHVYHPDFHGSFSIKKVLPALVPELDYSELEIGEGQTASLQLEAILFARERMSPEQYRQIREDLLKYCKLDTLAMVKLLEFIRSL